jgi:hypothetical protein
MQAIYHGKACNVECQIVLPHCLIPPIPLKLKISFQVSVSVIIMSGLAEYIISCNSCFLL